MSELKSSADVLNRFMGEAAAESAERVSIKYEDIRDGDRIRMSIEYTAANVGTGASSPDATYELIERPVQLPTEPGWYLGYDRLAQKPFSVQVTKFGVITHPMHGTKIGDPERFAPYTLLRPVAEVAAEVLAEVRATIESYGLDAPLDAISAKWATK